MDVISASLLNSAERSTEAGNELFSSSLGDELGEVTEESSCSGY